jgi:hypothetical protein
VWESVEFNKFPKPQRLARPCVYTPSSYLPVVGARCDRSGVSTYLKAYFEPPFETPKLYNLAARTVLVVAASTHRPGAAKVTLACCRQEKEVVRRSDPGLCGLRLARDVWHGGRCVQ